MLARALPADRPTFPTNYHEDHTLKDVLARGQRWRDAAVGSRVSRLGALTLYLSVATGLVINFPTLLLASVGVVACVGVVIWGFNLLHGVPGLDRRIRVFKGLQELRSMRHGNVVAQNATVEYDAALAMSDEELKRSEALLEKLLREETEIINERVAARERQQKETEIASQPPT